MNVTPTARKQSALLSEYKTRLRNTAKPRWSNAEYYLGINEALRGWAELVGVNHWYTLPDGFAAGTYEYALPSYIRPPIQVQVKRLHPYIEFAVEGLSYDWQDIPASLESDGEDGQVLRLHAPPLSLDGRVGWRAPNSVVPTTDTLPKTSAELSSSATSVTLTTVVDVDPVGTIQIGGEQIGYAGITRAASTTTLLNLERALYDTVAATHSADATVEWCVVVDDPALYNQLFDYTAYTLHRNIQSTGGTQEKEVHQQMMLFHKQNADNFWAGYRPYRSPQKLVLGPKKFRLR